LRDACGVIESEELTCVATRLGQGIGVERVKRSTNLQNAAYHLSTPDNSRG